MSSGGFFDQCSPVTVNGPTGPGNLCSFASGYGPPNTYGTGNPLFWIGQDGTVNLIVLSDTTTPAGLNSGCAATQRLPFDGAAGGDIIVPASPAEAQALTRFSTFNTREITVQRRRLLKARCPTRSQPY